MCSHSDKSTPKGRTEKIAGMDAYVTGPAQSKNVVLGIYDIFGMWNTTLQGADILAECLNTQVILPDFFRGEPWLHSEFPPVTDALTLKFNRWLFNTANMNDRIEDIQDIVKELKKRGYEKFGLYGFCWGGKIASLSGGESTPFVGVAHVHPALIVPDDSKILTVPVAFFPSKDEKESDVHGYWNNFKAGRPDLVEKSMFKHYTDSRHGFAAARADLTDDTNVRDFRDVYGRLGNFFQALF